jgi:D-alanyl-D-alanine carboxypeptidase/D-alanyl-D-alanine-endopeptidase (penicillin-binding protein 4)
MTRSTPETLRRAALATLTALLASSGGLVAQTPSRPPSVGPAAPGPLQLPMALKRRVDSWYATTTRRTGGTWGIAITDERGNLLWGRNTDLPLIPASTVKVFSTAYALSRLGPDFTRATRVVGVGALDTTTGQWIGTWQLQLNGDPTLEDPNGLGPRLYDLASQLAARGVRVLSGPMLITSAEPTTADASYPTAWRAANIGSIYAPLVGAVTVHENIVDLLVLPGARINARPRISRDTPLGVKDLVVNEAVTRASRRSRLRLVPLRDGRVALRGWIGNRAGMRRVRGASSDPRRVLEVAWEGVLGQAGIRWEKESPAMLPQAGAEAVLLAEVSSPRLETVAAMVNRRSLNIGAELLLRWAAGWEAPAESLTAHVREVVGTDRGIRLVDGSGLSHENRSTPRVMADYLARIPARRGTEQFPFLLPTTGSGTLARLRGGVPAGVVRAKTGTLSGSATLAGYLGRREGTYIVVLLFNGGRTRRARAAQWQLFRVLGGDGVQIPTDTEFGPSVVSDTLETAAPAPPDAPVPSDSAGTNTGGGTGGGTGGT